LPKGLRVYYLQPFFVFSVAAAVVFLFDEDVVDRGVQDIDQLQEVAVHAAARRAGISVCGAHPTASLLGEDPTTCRGGRFVQSTDTALCRR
jgi:hypothetical protein